MCMRHPEKCRRRLTTLQLPPPTPRFDAAMLVPALFEYQSNNYQECCRVPEGYYFGGNVEVLKCPETGS